MTKQTRDFLAASMRYAESQLAFAKHPQIGMHRESRLRCIELLEAGGPLILSRDARKTISFALMLMLADHNSEATRGKVAEAVVDAGFDAEFSSCVDEVIHRTQKSMVHPEMDTPSGNEHP